MNLYTVSTVPLSLSCISSNRRHPQVERAWVREGVSEHGSALDTVPHPVNDVGGQYETFRVSEETIKATKSKKVRRFYERQNAILVRPWSRSLSSGTV